MTHDRYYCATDGKITAWRQSATRVYRSVDFREFGFSFRLDGPTNEPNSVHTIEIDKATFTALIRARNLAYPSTSRTMASDSWAPNEVVSHIPLQRDADP